MMNKFRWLLLYIVCLIISVSVCTFYFLENNNLMTSIFFVLGLLHSGMILLEGMKEEKE